MHQGSQIRPFHESVRSAIQDASSREELEAIGRLLATTKVPKDQREVLESFEAKARKFGVQTPILEKVAGHLGEQKDTKSKGRPKIDWGFFAILGTGLLVSYLMFELVRDLGEIPLVQEY